jgi:hypothetical protein
MTEKYPTRPIDDITIKHLEFIQGVIGRLATDSFLMKGWAVTVGGAFWALRRPVPIGGWLQLACCQSRAFGAWMGTFLAESVRIGQCTRLYGVRIHMLRCSRWTTGHSSVSYIAVGGARFGPEHFGSSIVQALLCASPLSYSAGFTGNDGKRHALAPLCRRLLSRSMAHLVAIYFQYGPAATLELRGDEGGTQFEMQLHRLN